VNIGRALAPLAVVVAVVSLVVWLLLVNDVFLGAWLLAFLVFAHGWVHLMFVFPKPESPNAATGTSDYPFAFERSWLARRDLVPLPVVRTMGMVLMVAVFGLCASAALATVGVLLPASWWAVLMVGAGGASAIMLALFYSPALVLGFGIDAAMVMLVSSGSWRPS
jgi:hypothetical protein